MREADPPDRQLEPDARVTPPRPGAAPRPRVSDAERVGAIAQRVAAAREASIAASRLVWYARLLGGNWEQSQLTRAAARALLAFAVGGDSEGIVRPRLRDVAARAGYTNLDTIAGHKRWLVKDGWLTVLDDSPGRPVEYGIRWLADRDSGFRPWNVPTPAAVQLGERLLAGEPAVTFPSPLWDTLATTLAGFGFDVTIDRDAGMSRVTMPAAATGGGHA